MKRILFVFMLAAFWASPIHSGAAVTEFSQEAEVWICTSEGAVAYHKYRDCKGLNRCGKVIKKVTISEAKSRKLRACRICTDV